MIEIICGTNRPNSNSMNICHMAKALIETQGEKCDILDLREIAFNELDGSQYSENKPNSVSSAVERINQADGALLVIPEYNGSYPGILKYFIDHWDYPKTFEALPVAFIGLGGRFGGLRPVEHMQQVFAYRNAYLFPERVFLSNVWALIENEGIKDQMIADLMKSQAMGFVKFVRALKTEKLDANSRV